jgi:predicted RNA-binding Zn-ribbon protein involved in translation (DUF1610 family)
MTNKSKKRSTTPTCPKCNVSTKRVGARNKFLPPRFLCPSCGEVYVYSHRVSRKRTYHQLLEDIVAVFKVNRDFINDGKLNGRYFIFPQPVTIEERRAAVEWFEGQSKTKFRLRDDDGNVYFHVTMPELNARGIGANGRNDPDLAFLPLDSLGVSYGCTIIDIYSDGRYKQLNG